MTLETLVDGLQFRNWEIHFEQDFAIFARRVQQPATAITSQALIESHMVP